VLLLFCIATIIQDIHLRPIIRIFYARTDSHSRRRLPFDMTTTRPEEGTKRPRCQTDHLTPPKVEVTNVWSHISTSPFHTCLYGMYKDKMYFTLSRSAIPSSSCHFRPTRLKHSQLKWLNIQN